MGQTENITQSIEALTRAARNLADEALVQPHGVIFDRYAATYSAAREAYFAAVNS